MYFVYTLHAFLLKQQNNIIDKNIMFFIDCRCFLPRHLHNKYFKRWKNEFEDEDKMISAKHDVTRLHAAVVLANFESHDILHNNG